MRYYSIFANPLVFFPVIAKNSNFLEFKKKIYFQISFHIVILIIVNFYFTFNFKL